MPSFVTVTSGATAQAQDVNQLVLAMNGTAGSGVPISLTALNDSVNFALAVKNADPTNSRSLQVLRSNNNVLIQADATGVIVSPDGGATTAQVVNLSATQTLTNKTFDATTNTFQVLRGTLAARPAASVAGRLYDATDQNLIWLDTGAAWVLAGGFNTLTNALAAPLAMGAATTVYVGPTLTVVVGATYLVVGQASFTGPAAGVFDVELRMSDTTTIWAASAASTPAASKYAAITLASLVTPGTTTLRLEGYASVGGGQMNSAAPVSGAAGASSIRAVRVA